eukprot:g34362.t1
MSELPVWNEIDWELLALCSIEFHRLTTPWLKKFLPVSVPKGCPLHSEAVSLGPGLSHRWKYLLHVHSIQASQYSGSPWQPDCAPELAAPLAKLFQYSYNTGIYYTVKNYP